MIQLDLFADPVPAPAPAPAAPVVSAPAAAAVGIARPGEDKVLHDALCAARFNPSTARALIEFAASAAELGGLPLLDSGEYDFRGAARLVNVLNGRVASDKLSPTLETIASAFVKLREPAVEANPVVHPDIADAGDWAFADGGMILGNPSKIGGTWACVRVKDGVEVKRGCGLLLPFHLGAEQVTNNNTELLALCLLVLTLPEDWAGTVASDSNCALGWVFRRGGEFSVPPRLYSLLQEARARAKGWKYLCLAGHPEDDDLKAGRRMSKAPHLPVSRWNVLADALCTKTGADYYASLALDPHVAAEQIPASPLYLSGRGEMAEVSR